MSYKLTKMLLDIGDRLKLKPAERWALMVYCFRASDEGACTLGYERIAKLAAMDKSNLRKNCLRLREMNLLAQRHPRGIIVNKDELQKYLDRKREKKSAAKKKQQPPAEPPKNVIYLQHSKESDIPLLKEIIPKHIGQSIPGDDALSLLRCWKACTLCGFDQAEVIELLKPIYTVSRNILPMSVKICRLRDTMNGWVNHYIQREGPVPGIPVRFVFEDFLDAYPRRPKDFDRFLCGWYGQWYNKGTTPQQLMDALQQAKQDPDGFRFGSVHLVTPETWLFRLAQKYVKTPKNTKEQYSDDDDDDDDDDDELLF